MVITLEEWLGKLPSDVRRRVENRLGRVCWSVRYVLCAGHHKKWFRQDIEKHQIYLTAKCKGKFIILSSMCGEIGFSKLEDANMYKEFLSE